MCVVFVDPIAEFYTAKAFNSMGNSERVNIIRLQEAKEAQKRHDEIYPLGVSQHAQLTAFGHVLDVDVKPAAPKKRKSPKK